MQEKLSQSVRNFLTINGNTVDVVLEVEDIDKPPLTMINKVFDVKQIFCMHVGFYVVVPGYMNARNIPTANAYCWYYSIPFANRANDEPVYTTTSQINTQTISLDTYTKRAFLASTLLSSNISARLFLVTLTPGFLRIKTHLDNTAVPITPFYVAYTKCEATLWHDPIDLFVHETRASVTW